MSRDHQRAKFGKRGASSEKLGVPIQFSSPLFAPFTPYEQKGKAQEAGREERTPDFVLQQNSSQRSGLLDSNRSHQILLSNRSRPSFASGRTDVLDNVLFRHWAQDDSQRTVVSSARKKSSASDVSKSRFVFPQVRRRESVLEKPRRKNSQLMDFSKVLVSKLKQPESPAKGTGKASSHKAGGKKYRKFTKTKNFLPTAADDTKPSPTPAYYKKKEETTETSPVSVRSSGKKVSETIETTSRNLRTRFTELIPVSRVLRRRKSKHDSLSNNKGFDPHQLNTKLAEFFFVVDPEKPPEVREMLIKFAENRGVTRMNEKLRERYSTDLDTYLTYQDEKLHKTVSNNGKMDIRPSQLLHLLTCFYLKYDPDRAAEVQVKEVLNWTIKYGIPALKEQLRTGYFVELDSFDAELSQLTRALRTFFNRYDKSVFEENAKPSFDKILKWTLKNGIEQLNETLRAKYGHVIAYDLI